ncbi:MULTISPECIES: LpqN/LpqT family lipoprotein [unclassified Mycobacterium]|uniref:LpqN/LpqT family lipoprotein n=1 Tax=unclassified Mycobacterium TaxID=2642494 RepID=UPI0029C86718|nr:MULTISPECIES: LpqN/LpqT family lipoprotein [unclassified Mycobacterium]
MFENARRWGLLAGAPAAAMAVVVGFACATASADPVVPQPPLPAPATVTQTVTLAPQAAGLNVATPAAPAPATIVPATSVTIADFLKSKNVGLEPQKAADFKALNIVLPMPQGWSHVPDPNVPDAFAVIADRVGGDGLYTSNAALVVYKLVGDFDPKEAISHGLIDSQQQPAWRATDGSLADFGGMPSSFIEGTYRQNNLTLNSSRRHVIASSGPDRFLVTLTVTTSAQVSVAAGDATDAILRGYKVTSPDAPPAAPLAATPAAPVAAAPALPVSAPVNQLLGTPR